MRNKKGFTLAEVLVTLTIIGVVASMTIPSLIHDFQEKQWKVAFKKTFSELNRANIKIKTDNDGILWQGFQIGGIGDVDNMRNAYLDYMPAVKTRDKDEAVGECFTVASKLLNGADDNRIFPFFSRATLITGVSLAFFRTSSQCTSTMGDLTSIVCGFMVIDVNNVKGPNTCGKDIYQVRITKNGIVPDGSHGINEGDCHSSGWGTGCAALVLKNEDY